MLHFIVGALMASYGHEVDSIDGNTILTWQIESTSAAKGVIACCYIFVGVYGITWVTSPRYSWRYLLCTSADQTARRPSHGSTHQKFSL